MKSQLNSFRDLKKRLQSRNEEGKYDAIIERAANFGYHDFKFDSVPGHPEYGDCNCPKMQLVEDLSVFPELNDIRSDVMDGMYDDSSDEIDSKIIRGWLLEDGSPDKLFTMILGQPAPTEAERKLYQLQKKMN